MAVLMRLGASNEGLSIDAVIKALIVPGSVAEMGEALVEISATGGDQSSMSIPGVFGDDIDYGVTAFAPQMVPPGPRMTSMRSISSSNVSWTCQ